MKELLEALTAGLVEDRDSVLVYADEPNEEGVTVYHIKVAEGDVGRVIGKQGKIAKAIRTIARSAAVRKGLQIQVEID